jgi:hypothetical protein
MTKNLVWTKAIGLAGGSVVEAETSLEARQAYAAEDVPGAGDVPSIMARALETSEGELGYWTQGDNGPVWKMVGKA